jgi:hypothetical protein
VFCEKSLDLPDFKGLDFFGGAQEKTKSLQATENM